MPLSSSDAKELFNLGFKRPAYEDEVYIEAELVEKEDI